MSRTPLQTTAGRYRSETPGLVLFIAQKYTYQYLKLTDTPFILVKRNLFTSAVSLQWEGTHSVVIPGWHNMGLYQLKLWSVAKETPDHSLFRCGETHIESSDIDSKNSDQGLNIVKGLICSIHQHISRPYRQSWRSIWVGNERLR